MDSVPPASTALASPNRMSCAPCVIASKPEPHSRLTVTAGTPIGRPAFRPMWRGAGDRDAPGGGAVAAKGGAPPPPPPRTGPPHQLSPPPPTPPPQTGLG